MLTVRETKENIEKDIENGLEWPEWTSKIPACQDPFFVSGIENLKAIALAESPLVYRIRKIFVLENFLERI